MRASLAVVLVLVGCQSPTKNKDGSAPAGSGSAGSATREGSAARADEATAPAPTEGDAKPAAALAWGPTRATTVAIGPFTAPIPKGWRDTAELVDQKLVAGLPAQARGLMRETVTSTDFRSNIVLQWTPVLGDADMPCQTIADATKGQSPLVPVAIQTIKIEGDRGCRWDVEAPAAKGTQVLRFHGDHLLLVQVLYARAGDAEAVGAFDQVLAGVRKK